MSEQNISPLVPDVLMAIERYIHFREGEPGQISERIILNENWRQCRPDLSDTMTKVSGKSVSVTI
jgi:hypothetical protein